VTRYGIWHDGSLLEQVVGFAAYQGLSRGSRVEVAPWLFPNQLYRSGVAAHEGLSRGSRVESTPRLFPNQLCGGVISPGHAKDPNASLFADDAPFCDTDVVWFWFYFGFGQGNGYGVGMGYELWRWLFAMGMMR
jgi:hypothetical protein